MSLNFNDIETKESTGTYVNKSLGLGNHSGVRIYNIELQSPAFDAEAYQLMITFVGQAEPGFEGWPIDPENPNKGNFKGPMSRVSASPFVFKNGTTKSGTKVSRDHAIMRTIKELALELGLVDELKTIDADTIEEVVAASAHVFRASRAKLDILVGGSLYIREGKKRYNYYLFAKDGIRPYKNSENDDRMIPAFNEANHVYVSAKAQADLASLETSQNSVVAATNNEDDLDW